MRKLVCGIGALACVLLAGCGSSPAPVEEGIYQPPPARLGDTIDISLEQLLTKPRAELAALAEEWAAKIQVQQQGRLEGKLPFTLLPELRLPLAVPVWRSAQFSAKVGSSLPPYVAEDSKDSELALHLARFGDTEAALKLVEPTDTATRSQIEACQQERNYPVEWTRLVGLLLHAAQMRLATGDVDGGTEVVVLHRQLQALLDSKATQGLLGATLLPRGREALARAMAAWRADKKTELAEQAAAALATWGEAPPTVLGIGPGTARAEVNRLLRSPGTGPASPALATARAFDLFRLPFPDEGAEAVIVFFDSVDRLTELYVTYRVGFSDHYPEPAQLAYLLEERALPAQEAPKANGLRRRTYALGTEQAEARWACEVLTVAHGAGLGAAIRLHDGKETLDRIPLPRDFGDVHLDRSFEQNRIRFTPEQRRELLKVEQPKTLARLTNPLPALKLSQASLEQAHGQDVASQLVLHYPTDGSRGVPTLHQVALPLWATLGPSRWEGVGDSSGGHLALVWQDTGTRYTLQLPYENGKPVELEVRDVQGTEQVAQRVAQAVLLDQTERAARIEAGKALTRIPRHLEQIELGLRRAEVLPLLPPGSTVLKRELPGGLTVTFSGDPGRGGSVVRQLFIRFDQEDRVIELRARHVDQGAQSGTAWMGEILNIVKKRCGAPLEQPASWAAVWADLPPRKPAAVQYQWQDDLSRLAYERDSGGVELRLSDWTKQGAQDTFPALEYLPRGPENCPLGMARDELLRKWGVGQPATADGALVLPQPPSSSYDALLVWFEKEIAVRIVARHQRQGSAAAGNLNPAVLASAVTEAWGRDLRSLGWPRRQDLTTQNTLQSLAWHDDHTRVRIFWQESESGLCRLFTEWKELSK
jgi:hypothetical protein